MEKSLANKVRVLPDVSTNSSAAAQFAVADSADRSQSRTQPWFKRWISTIRINILAFQVTSGNEESTVQRPKSSPTDCLSSNNDRVSKRSSWDRDRWSAILEAALIFICFALFAGQLPPDVNESHYLTKAKHFWNPEYCGKDIFLSSSFAHWLFYVGFGWLTKIVSLTSFAWIGRVLTWALLAMAWCRTSRRLFRFPFFPTVTAMCFLLLNDRFHLAGEWVVGGFEAKGLAYVFVVLAIGEMVNLRWKYVWPLLGVGAAFHVLVGGWAMVAAIFTWLVIHWPNADLELPDRPTLDRSLHRQLKPFLVGLILLAAGAVPPLLANFSTDSELAATANLIYVNHRIAHHLTFDAFPTEHIARFVLMTAVWVTIFRWSKTQMASVAKAQIHRFGKSSVDVNHSLSPAQMKNRYWLTHAIGMRTLFCFGIGSLLISFGGLMLSAIGEADEGNLNFSASLLRFYWFRLADFAIPATLALSIGVLMSGWLIERSRPRVFCAILFSALIMTAGLITCFERHSDPRPIADQRSLPDYEDDRVRTLQTFENWVKVCDWIRTNTPQEAVFVTPYQQQTFKWYAGRTEVVNWKDIPQDAEGIVQWSSRVAELVQPQKRTELGLMAYSDEQLIKIAKQYDADFLLIAQRQLDLASEPTKLQQVYPEVSGTKSTYVVLRFKLNQ